MNGENKQKLKSTQAALRSSGEIQVIRQPAAHCCARAVHGVWLKTPQALVSWGEDARNRAMGLVCQGWMTEPHIETRQSL